MLISKRQLLAEIENMQDRQRDQAEAIRDLTAQNAQYVDRIKILEGALGDYEEMSGKVGDYLNLGYRLKATEEVLREHIHEEEEEEEVDPFRTISAFSPATGTFLKALCRDAGKNEDDDA